MDQLHKEVTEISQDIFRLSVAPNAHFEFNQFLIRDEKTCLIHTGKLSLFAPLKDMVQEHLQGKNLDYIVFSHFEADECGSVNEWLKLYPAAKVVCNKVANINLGDFLVREAQVLKDGESIRLGHYELELIETPHFPHNWDAHMWLEKSQKILFSSDFCCHGGISTPMTSQDISPEIISFYEKGRFIPYGKSTNENLEKLAQYDFKIIAPMHGATLMPDVARSVFKRVSSDLQSRS